MYRILLPVAQTQTSDKGQLITLDCILGSDLVCPIKKVELRRQCSHSLSHSGAHVSIFILLMFLPN